MVFKNKKISRICEFNAAGSKFPIAHSALHRSRLAFSEIKKNYIPTFIFHVFFFCMEKIIDAITWIF